MKFLKAIALLSLTGSLVGCGLAPTNGHQGSVPKDETPVAVPKGEYKVVSTTDDLSKLNTIFTDEIDTITIDGKKIPLNSLEKLYINTSDVKVGVVEDPKVRTFMIVKPTEVSDLPEADNVQYGGGRGNGIVIVKDSPSSQVNRVRREGMVRTIDVNFNAKTLSIYGKEHSQGRNKLVDATITGNTFSGKDEKLQDNFKYIIKTNGTFAGKNAQYIVGNLYMKLQEIKPNADSEVIERLDTFALEKNKSN